VNGPGQGGARQAQLNLRDAYVKAPFNGILQTRTVQTGQYIQVGTVMATLVRRDPLLLRFKVPERDSARISVGKRPTSESARLTRNLPPDRPRCRVGRRELAHGRYNGRDQDSSNEILRPGSFAEITVPVSGRGKRRSSPDAVRPSRARFLAYLVENDLAVERV